MSRFPETIPDAGPALARPIHGHYSCNSSAPGAFRGFLANVINSEAIVTVPVSAARLSGSRNPTLGAVPPPATGNDPRAALVIISRSEAAGADQSRMGFSDPQQRADFF
jgi:hypothetical protein